MSSESSEFIQKLPIFYPYIDKKNKLRIERLSVLQFKQMTSYFIKQLTDET